MTLMCIERSQSPTHKVNFLQGRKSPVNNNNSNNNNNNNINQQNANHQRRNSCSPPLSKSQQQQDVSNAIKSLNLESSRKLERSTSEPADRRASVQSNSSRYKTELCRPYEENGTCKYGDKCQFAHGVKELRSMARHPKYKTELCRTFHSTGLCPYGPRCHFIHNRDKNSFLTNLTGNVTDSPPLTRPKALTSLGSAGDISPVSSHGGSPTGIKSFDDLYQQQATPLSPTLNNAFSFPQDFANLVNSLNQRFVEIPARDFNTDIYESVNVFNEGILSTATDGNVDNYNYQGGPVLDLFQTAPLTPPTPVDGNGSFFIPPTLPIFDLFHNSKQQVM